MSSSGPSHRTRAALTLAALIFVTACASDNPVAPSSMYAPTFGQSLQDVQGLYVVEVSGASTQGVTAAIVKMGATVRAVVPQIRMVTVSGLDASKVATLASRADVAGVYRDML